ncbi:hypothetical protein [Streptomyces cellostaticus]|uniref:hypothetical protein n=1 Tax=Streptomyces cellostaticus TaxID=67285 RepID=UPI00131D281A|nr:hypothetical protein [Streptomyces cellostaticus]
MRVEWYERAAAPDGGPAWLLTVIIRADDGAAPSVCCLLSAVCCLLSAQGQGMLM